MAREAREMDDALLGAAARVAGDTPDLRAPRVAAPRGSRNDHTRRNNLSALLTAVHYRGPLTRAQLTRDTGLNRSTIGGLVAELADLGLVVEDASAETGAVGRPSLIVRIRREVAAIAFHPDIDGLDSALVALDGTVLARRRRAFDEAPTPALAADAMVEEARALLRRSPVERVVGTAVAVPGLVDADGGTVVHAAHLGWRREPLGARLAEPLGVPVAVGNDANLGLRAEWSFGAARGADNVVFLNGSSSGIGGAALVGGVMLRGGRGYGGEFGHMLVRTPGRECSCGRRGCLETEVSAARLAEVAGVSTGAVAGGLGELAGDDAAVAREVDRQAALLGTAIANLECAFDPDAVLLGGYLGDLYECRAEEIGRVVQTEAFRPDAEGALLGAAALGRDLRVIGAAERAFAPLLLDPAGTPLVPAGAVAAD